MKYIQISAQTIFLFIMPLIGNAETTCLDKVKTLELKRNHAVSIGGMWGYFEKNFSLKKNPAEAIQLDSRINKIFFLLSHLCKTRNGIPLTFKDELLLLGKTPQQIKEWFDFCYYSENRASRTLIRSKISKAMVRSSALVMRYVQLAEAIPHRNSLKEYFQKMKNLTIDVDHLLSNQPYLSQALE